jgi:class 3 adenylate cyclase
VPERRRITVLFSDLVGSTAMSERMDAEDLREVISAYQRCVAEAVRRFDGFVAKYMGDGVLVYFGYPEAHEDDPERAVRAGLELVAALPTLGVKSFGARPRRRRSMPARRAISDTRRFSRHGLNHIKNRLAQLLVVEPRKCLGEPQRLRVEC